MKQRDVDCFPLVKEAEAFDGALANEIVLIGDWANDLIVQFGENLVAYDLKSCLSYSGARVFEVRADSTKKFVPVTNGESFDSNSAIFDCRSCFRS